MEKHKIDWVTLATLSDEDHDSICKTLESCWITRANQATDLKDMLRDSGIESPSLNAFEKQADDLARLLRMLGGWKNDDIL